MIQLALSRCHRAILIGAVALLSGHAVLAEDAASKTRFGFTPFPYDSTVEAVDTTHALIGENSTIYAFHLDDGIPWREAHENRTLPQRLRTEWARQARHVPRGHQVYLALAPLAKDRRNLAPASEGSKRPKGFEGDRFDSTDVKRAYLNYARTAIATFRPDYVNLGIEAGELAGKDEKAWERFTELYGFVRNELKKDFPELPMGISFSLHQLWGRNGIAELASPVVENSDYVCLSFYPYASSFGEKLHRAKKLPAPPDQWRTPLQWIRDYTDKPLAICETGYSSVDVEVDDYDLFMKGSTDLQQSYVSDLGRIAERDDYLFVVWFLAIDYDSLYEKLPEGDGSNRIWKNIGFLDGKLNPKPAWSHWQRIVGGHAPVSARARARARVSEHASPRRELLGFSDRSQLFESPDDVKLTNEVPEAGTHSMRWSFDYGGQWHWAHRSLKREELDGATHVSFRIKSDWPTPMFFQLEEDGGETFFSMIFVEEDWQEIHLELDELDVDPKKKQDGRLESSRLSQVLIADNAGTQNAKGTRQIWIADLAFVFEP